MEPALRGLFVPLITPFTTDGEIAIGALEALAHAVLDGGAAGLVALGTTGEPATLTAGERRAVMDACARVSRERGVLLIAGAGSNDTAATAAALLELAHWPEVSAALTLVPYYTRPSQEGVVAHFTRLAAVSPVPLIVYNVPDRTGCPLSGQTLLRLARLPGIAGIKQAAGRVDQDTVTLMAGRPVDFAVLAGDDAFASPLLALGAAGGILASAHLRTGDFAALIDAWHSPNAAQARQLGHRLVPLSAALFAEPNPVVIKAVLHAEGLIPSPMVRLPLLEASRASVSAALDVLRGLAKAPAEILPRQASGVQG
jgi:4-hydroxy-tetrahydrodipicolinate synthase